MRKQLFAVLLAALLVTPAAAQWQVPNHSIPVGRGAGTGFNSITPCANGLVYWGSVSADPACLGTNTGTRVFIFDSVNPLNAPGLEIAVGSDASPITTPGPTIRLSRTENINNALCDSIQGNNECNAALAVYSKGLSGTGMQANAIYAGATSDSSTHDVLALSAIGRATGTATGIGTGAYLEGRRDTATGKAAGAEIRSSNVTGTPGTYNPAGFSDTIGLWITAGDSQPSGVGVALGTAPQPWTTGFAATNGSVTGATFRDDTNSNISLQINGTHAGGQITGTGFSVSSTGAGSFTNVAVTGSSTPTIGLNAATANSLSIYTRGAESARFSSQVSPVNFLNVTAASTGGAPAFSAIGSDTDIPFSFSTKGTGQFAFATASFGATQFLVQHTASANRQLIVTGSNGGNPTLSTSGGGINAAPSNGHVATTGGSQPTNSACTGFAVTGNDTAGRITTGGVTTCTINFGTAYAAAPFCIVSPGSAASTHFLTTSTTQLAVTFGTAQSAFFYHCFGS